MLVSPLKPKWQKPYILKGMGYPQSAQGLQTPRFGCWPNLKHTSLPIRKTMRDREHHYTTDTNSGIGLRRMSKHLRALAPSGPTTPNT